MEKIYRIILFLGLAAILIFAPIARGAVNLWSITPVLLIAYAIIFIWLFRINNTTGTVHIRGQFLTLPIALFAILAVMSFELSIYKHDSFYALLRLFACIGLYYAVANGFTRIMRRGVIWIAISVGTALSVYGLLQYFGLLDRSWWIPQQFLASTYVNHNHFAGYLELVIPVAAGVIVSRRSSEDRGRVIYRMLLVASLAIMAAAFIFTQSRGAWISLGAAMSIFMVAILKKNTGRTKIAAIVILMLVAVMGLLYFSQDVVVSRMETMTGAAPGQDISGGRFGIWQGAVGMIMERPLSGVGIGNFDNGFYRYRPSGFNARAVYAHNDYLQAAAEMGLAAPLVMVWMITLVVMTGFSKREHSPYALGCAAGMLSLSLHGLVDFNFHITANMLLFTVWAAIITGETYVKRA